jgi:hypothetical protein
MKKILTAALVAGSLTGCGIIEDLANELNKLDRLNAGQVALTGYQLSDAVLEVNNLSGGIQGLAPKLGNGNGSPISLAPSSARLAAIQDPNWKCLSSYSGQVTEENKTDYAAHQEEKSANITLDYKCLGAGDGPYITAVNAEIEYKDGSTGTTSFVETEGDDTPDDVTEGFGKLTVHRYFPEPDKRTYAFFEATLDLQGSWEAPNLWKQGKHIVKMRNGTEVTAEIIADEPFLDGEDFTAGTATRTIVHAEGNIKSTTETAEITGKDTGTYTLVNEYQNGTKDEITVTADGNQVTLDAKGHNGFTRTGSLHLVSGDFKLETTFPAGMVITKVTEWGKWQKNATNGEYNRTVELATGRIIESHVKANINGDAITATFTHEDDASDEDKSDLVSGSLSVVRNAFGTSLKFEVSNADGDKATLEGIKYADGSATLSYTKDLKSTPVNPDEEGEFTFNADGSGVGSITVHAAGVTKTITVTVQPDGTVSE